MLHDFLYTALQNIAESVDGVNLYILILPKAIDLGAVDVVVSIQVILGNALFLHRLPETIIFNHNTTPPKSCLTFVYYGHKIKIGTVFV